MVSLLKSFICIKLLFLRRLTVTNSYSACVETSSNVWSCHHFSHLSTESLPAADVEYDVVRPQTKRKEKEEEEVQYGEVAFNSEALKRSRE